MGRQAWLAVRLACRASSTRCCPGVGISGTRGLGLTMASQGACWAQRTRLFASFPAHTTLSMPALSPTMSQGNIAQWQVKEGQEITAGDVLADIETDKATLAWENQDDGFIARILKPSGSKDIPVGTPCAIVVEDQDNVAAFKDYQPEEGAGSSAGGAEGQQQQQSGEQQQEGAGQQEQQQQPGDPAAAPQQRSGKMGPAARNLLLQHGLSAEDITPTGPRGIVTKGDVLQAIAGGAKPRPQEPAGQEQPQAAPTQGKGQEGAGQAQAQAKPQQLPSGEQPAGSGPSRGQQDQHQTAQRRGKPGPRYTDIPNSQIRKIIAQRLLESKQRIPHYYVQATADLQQVTVLRKSLKEAGQKVSINDFVVRAAALALSEVPQANARWDDKADEIVPCGSVDIAIAVATDAGLITPIVPQANTKSLQQISAEVRELASRARANKLKPHEFQGGSFSISNLGMYGVDRFRAIINPPQACIMAVGGTQQQVELVNGTPRTRPTMTVTLSADQRVYDGETAATFLAAFCSNMANPVKMLA